MQSKFEARAHATAAVTTAISGGAMILMKQSGWHPIAMMAVFWPLFFCCLAAGLGWAKKADR